MRAAEAITLGDDAAYEACLSALGAARVARIDDVLSRRTRALTVLLENVHDSHNIAAVFRTCEASGLQEVHVVDRTGDFTVSRRLTQGCHKWLDGGVHAGVDEAARDLRSRGFRLLAATLAEGAVPLPELDLSGRVALVFGNESEGLSDAMVAACDGAFVIPMRGFSQSLNVSVSAAIALRHALAAREWPPLEEDDLAALRRRWIMLAAKQSGRILEALLQGAEPPEGPFTC